MNVLGVYISEATLWAMVVGVVSNVACAVLGCHLVLRRLSLLGDAISHAVLPGIVIGYLLSGSVGVLTMLAGAWCAAILTSALTDTLSRYGNVPEDASMGVVFTSLFALGVVLVSRYARNVHIDADCVLYGLIDTAALDAVPLAGWYVPRVLLTLVPVLVVTLVFLAVFWKELKLSSFDPALAAALGFRPGLVHYLFMGMVATVTVASFEAVGSILVIAMLIVPAATAQLLTDRLLWMVLLAACVGAVSAVVGCWGAALWNTSAAGMMAVVAGGQFAVAVCLAPRYGLLSKAWHTWQLGLRIVGEDVMARLFRAEESAHAASKGTAAAALPRSPAGDIARLAGGAVVGRLALARLWWRGDVAYRPDAGLTLTDSGRRLAQMLVRGHRLWESYLGEHFALPLDHLHEPAERLEHFLGPQLQEQLAEQLAEPGRDPHGRAIPPST
ncbi:MAG: metal ABC transporter permease [Pirellulales bacterium]